MQYFSFFIVLLLFTLLKTVHLLAESHYKAIK